MKNLRKKITGLIIAASIMSIGVGAMAATSGTTSDSKGTYQSNAEGKMTEGRHGGKGGFAKDGIGKGNMEDTLKSLVSAGTITQEESDKILALSKEKAAARQAEMDKVKNMTDEERKAYFEAEKDKNTDSKGDIFTQAVKGGIITQEKADAAKAKVKETRTAERKAEITKGLNELVTAGTITQEQSDKIVGYMATLETNKPAKDSIAATSDQKKSPLSALVDDGTLTQAQLDEVSKVIHFGGHGHGGNGDKGMGKQAKDSAADASTNQAS